MIGAVARAYRPGLQGRHVAGAGVAAGLQQVQGASRLVPDRAWFTDDVPINIGRQRRQSSARRQA